MKITKVFITMLLIIVTQLGCSKSNENSISTNITGPGNTNISNQLAIGQNYQGGIIFYFFVKGDNRYIAGETHGIIASDIDYSGTWSTEVTLLNNSKIVLTSVDSIENSSIGMSKFNTEKIVRNFT